MASSSSQTASRGSLLKQAMEKASNETVCFNGKRTRGISGTAKFTFFVKWFKGPTKSGGYYSIGGHIFNLLDLKQNEQSYTVSDDRTEVSFKLGGADTFTITRDTYFFLGVPDNIDLGKLEVNTWWVAGNINVSPYIDNQGNRRVNINAGSFEPWEEAPKDVHLFEFMFQAFDPCHSNVRPFPISLFPIFDVDASKNEIKVNTELTDDQRKAEIKKFTAAAPKKFEALLYNHIARMTERKDLTDDERYFTELFDVKKEGDIRSVTPNRKLVFAVSNSARLQAEEIDHEGKSDTISMVFKSGWNDTMFVKKSDGTYTNGGDRTKDRPDKRMTLAKCLVQYIRVHMGEIQNLDVELLCFNDAMMDAFCIYNPEVGDRLFMPRLNELEMIVTGKPLAHKTWDMQQNLEIRGGNTDTFIKGLTVAVEDVILDYRHFFNHVCCRVTSEVAEDLFRAWMLRRGAKVTSKETLSADVLTKDRNIPGGIRADWSYYLSKRPRALFSRMSTVDNNVMNMMGCDSSSIDLADRDNYLYFVFCSGVFKDEAVDISTAHSDPTNDEHLEEVSADIATFCKTGHSELFHRVDIPVKDQEDQGPEFQIYVIYAEFFRNEIMKRYVVPQQANKPVLPDLTSSTSSVEWVGRSASDLLDDDQGHSVNDILTPSSSSSSSTKDDAPEPEPEPEAELDPGLKPVETKSKLKRSRRL